MHVVSNQVPDREASAAETTESESRVIVASLATFVFKVDQEKWQRKSTAGLRQAIGLLSNFVFNEEGITRFIALCVKRNYLRETKPGEWVITPKGVGWAYGNKPENGKAAIDPLLALTIDRISLCAKEMGYPLLWKVPMLVWEDLNAREQHDRAVEMLMHYSAEHGTGAMSRLLDLLVEVGKGLEREPAIKGI